MVDEAVMAIGVHAAAAILRGTILLFAQLLASVTVTMTSYAPLAVGVPERMPFVAIVRPVPDGPLAVQVTEPLPPVCVNCAL